MTPEDRQRIYLEEKARLEIRQKLQSKKKDAGCGSLVGYALFVIVGLYIILFIVGLFQDDSKSRRFDALTPEQKRAETLRECASFEATMAFKTYSELTPAQRKAKFDCESIESTSRPRDWTDWYALTPEERQERRDFENRPVIKIPSVDELIRRRYEAEGKKAPK